MSYSVPAVQSVDYLYPLHEDRSIVALVQSVMSWRKNIDGKAILHRELAPAERETLQQRFNLLTNKLECAKVHAIRERIGQMIMGFSASVQVKEKDAKTIGSQYAQVLRTLPMWAIDRAVGKFERGDISIEQVEGVNRAFWPSTAQLYFIASGYSAEFFKERREIYSVLHGVTEYEATPEERERVSEGLQHLASALKMDVDAEKKERKSRRKKWVGPTDEDLIRQYGKKSA